MLYPHVFMIKLMKEGGVQSIKLEGGRRVLKSVRGLTEAGDEFGAELVLADQPIEDTGRRLGSLLALTLVQLLTPWKGGWTAWRSRTR